MGKLLALILWIITIGSVAMFVSRYWWFPENISAHGVEMDAQFMRTLAVVGVAFVLAQCALGYVVFRFGSNRKGNAVYSHGSSKLEVTWTIVTGVVFVILAVLGQRVWAEMHFNEPPADAVQVEVTGQQFAWNFRYTGADGQFGDTDPKQVDDSGGNPIGIKKEDPKGQDDIVSSTLAIPVNKPIHLILKSKDVIHSLFIPSLRFKQDAVPGLSISMHFTATTIGKGQYEIACAELCGLGHYKMKSFVDVMSGEDFEKWLQTRSGR